MSQGHFDLVVIGTGAAALGVAYACRQAGWSVAVVDFRPYGGTCAIRGCDPKKVLMGAAATLDQVSRMRTRGVQDGLVRISWPELMRFKRTFTDPVPQAREQALEEAGIARCHGVARFVSEDTVEVGGSRMTARHFVIASGAAPVKLGIEGEELLFTSDGFLEMKALPSRLAFIGGGYIAFEFAHIATRAGASVSILHRGARPLEQFDPDLAGKLCAHSEAVGIEIHLETAAERVERNGRTLILHGSNGVRVDADAIVHAAGRTPALNPLNLKAANVESTGRGVTVNDYLQSPSNPRVYAAGDAAASGPALTPVAGYHSRIVARNLLEGNTETAEYAGCASTVFTLPPLASVGLTEESARTNGLKFRVNYSDTSAWYSSRRIGEECSAYKVLIEQGTDRILGAHLLGEGSEELINVFALAIRCGLPARDVRSTLFAYPTHGSNVQYMLG